MRLLQALASIRTLLAVMAVGIALSLVAAILSTPVSDGTYDRPYGRLFSLVSAALLFAWVAARAAFVWLQYRRCDEAEWRVAEPRPLPAPLVPRAAELAALGFQPLGELEVRLPWQPWKHGWLMTSTFEPVTATLGTASWPFFSTVWPDGAYLITVASGALGSDIRTPFACQILGHGGVATSLARHRLEGALFGAQRPYPLQVHSMEAAMAVHRLTATSSKRLLARAFRSPIFVGTLLLPLALAVSITGLTLFP